MRYVITLDADTFLTDGGIETTLIFHRGLDLPLFASYKLLEDGREVAAEPPDRGLGEQVGVVADPPVQAVRASIADRDWNGERLERLVDVLTRKRKAFEPPDRAGSKSDAAGQRPFDPRAGFVEQRVALEPGITGKS